MPGTHIGAIDEPKEGAIVANAVHVAGWAFSADGGITGVEAFLDDVPLGPVAFGQERPDVVAAHRHPNAINSGFEGVVFLDEAFSGPHEIVVCATDACGTQSVYRRSIVIAPIIGNLDLPKEDHIGWGTVHVAGWAFSADGGITGVEAFLDDVPLGPVAFGQERPDVVAAHRHPNAINSGFEGVVSLNPSACGQRTLRVRVMDTAARTRDFTCALLVQQPAIELFLDTPRAGQCSAGIVDVAGWAFSYDAPIAAIEARLGDELLGPVAYGFERQDVANAFRHRNAACSGFRGVLTFPSVGGRRDVLIVQARDTNGNVAEVQAPLQLVTLSEPLAEIDRVLWRDNHLNVEGWAMWPAGSTGAHAHIFLDDALIGQSPIHLSRPDVERRFPSQRAAYRSGFRFSKPLAGPARGSSLPRALSVEFVDDQGRRIQRATHLAHDRDSIAVPIGDLASEVAARIDDFAKSSMRPPSVLDWHTGLHLAELFPQYAIFSPPRVGTGPTLPHADQSVDLAVVATTDSAIIGEAERVASAVIVISDGGVDGPRPRIEQGRQQTRISIIIPVHDNLALTQACYAGLVDTLPGDSETEIVFIDDASTDGTAAALDDWACHDPRVRVLHSSENRGYLLSCNHGADAATGSILVFLNNDTVPCPDWLPPLVRTFTDRPDTGAVGGKLLYPDGTLQEAGGVIFSDGTGYNFGRNDRHADAPLYTFVRETDYCSGALLATKRATFHELGGFDIRFAPAYYEDTDYCFRLRAHGLRVYYQPESAVVHHEGASSGTDTTVGVKRFQEINREKFVAKWRDALRQQPLPVRDFGFATRLSLVIRDERGSSAINEI